jgi:16S rRNA (uracil1498-N3)-methyltransferase
MDGSRVLLDGTELHHLRVRRLRVGDAVILMDGCGRERPGTVTEIADRRAVIVLSVDNMGGSNESSLTLKLAVALIKPDKLDLVVEKATELGVSEVIPYSSERCIANTRRERVSRWRRIAQSAAKQSQRAYVPTVRDPIAFEQLLLINTDHTRLLFWERASTGSSWPANGQSSPTRIVAAVGPEGGLTGDEAEAARSAGFHILGLGPRILRAETAAIAAIVLCQNRWGDLRG